MVRRIRHFAPTYGLIDRFREYQSAIRRLPPRTATHDLGDAILHEAEFWLDWTRKAALLVDSEYWPTATVNAVLWELASIAEAKPTREEMLEVRELMYTGAGMAHWFAQEEEFGDSLIRWSEPQLRDFLAEFVDPDLIEEGHRPPGHQAFESIFDLRAAVLPEQLELIGWRVKDSSGETICV